MAKAKAKKPARRRRKKAPPEPPPVELWERQDGESAVAFQGFARFRDMGPERSLNKVARSLSKSRSLVGEWSTKHHWQSRSAAWDLELDRQQQEELKEKRLEAASRHAEMARGFMVGLGRSAQELLERLGTDEGAAALRKLPLEKLVPMVVQGGRAAARVAEMERLALGMTTDNIGGHDGGPLITPEDRARGMSDPELDAFLTGAAAGQAAKGPEE